jgi:hypothetical protein
MTKLKTGEKVFVVPQVTRYRTGEPFYTEVTRVGKKYGYILRYGCERPFDLLTGASHHKENNDRINGFGFDVYKSEDEYNKEQKVASDYADLKSRLRGNYDFPKLPPEVVDKITAILNEYSI